MDDRIKDELRQMRECNLDAYGEVLKELGELKEFDKNNVLSNYTKLESLNNLKYNVNKLVRRAHSLFEEMDGSKSPHDYRMEWFDCYFRRTSIADMIHQNPDIDVFRAFVELTPISATDEPRYIVPDFIYLYKGDIEDSPFMNKVIEDTRTMDELFGECGVRFFRTETHFYDYYVGGEDEVDTWIKPLYDKVFPSC